MSGLFDTASQDQTSGRGRSPSSSALSSSFCFSDCSAAITIKNIDRAAGILQPRPLGFVFYLESSTSFSPGRSSPRLVSLRRGTICLDRELIRTERLIYLDACHLDHLCPALGVLCHEPSEVGRRATGYHAAHVDDALPDVRLGERVAGVLVQQRNDVGRYVCRRNQA